MTTSSVTNTFISAVFHLSETSREEKQERKAVKEKILNLSRGLFQDSELQIKHNSDLEKAIVLLNRLQPRFFNKNLNETETFFDVLFNRFPDLVNKIYEKNTQEKPKNTNDHLLSVDHNPSLALVDCTEKLKDVTLSQDEKEKLICKAVGKHPLDDPNIILYFKLSSNPQTQQTVLCYHAMHLLWSACCDEREYTYSQQHAFWLDIKQLQHQTPHADNLSYFIHLMLTIQPQDSQAFSEDTIKNMIREYEHHTEELLKLMRNALFSFPESRKGKEKEGEKFRSLDFPAAYAPPPHEKKEEKNTKQLVNFLAATHRSHQGPSSPRENKEKGMELHEEKKEGLPKLNFILVEDYQGSPSELIRKDVPNILNQNRVFDSLQPNWERVFLAFDQLLKDSSFLEESEQESASSKIALFLLAMPYCETPDKLVQYYEHLHPYLDRMMERELYYHLIVHRLCHELFNEMGLDLSQRLKLWRLFNEKTLLDIFNLADFFLNTISIYFDITINESDFDIDDKTLELYYLALKNVWKHAFIKPDQVSEFLIEQSLDAPGELYLQRILLTAFLIDWDSAIDYFQGLMKHLPKKKKLECIQFFYPHLPWFLPQSAKLLREMAEKFEEIEEYIVAQQFFTEWCSEFPKICPKTVWDMFSRTAQSNNQSILTIALSTWSLNLEKLDEYSNINLLDFQLRLANPQQRKKILEDISKNFNIEEDENFTKQFQIKHQANSSQGNGRHTSRKQMETLQITKRSQNENNEIKALIDGFAKEGDLSGLNALFKHYEDHDQKKLAYANTYFMETHPILFENYLTLL